MRRRLKLRFRRVRVIIIVFIRRFWGRFSIRDRRVWFIIMGVVSGMGLGFSSMR